MRRGPGVFFIGAVVFSGLLALFSLIDISIGVPLASLSLKVIYIAALTAVVNKNKYNCLRSKNRRAYLCTLLVFAFALVIQAGELNLTPRMSDLLLGFFGVATTVVSEELYFRVIGRELLKGTGKPPLSTLLIAAAVFALSHSVNFFFNPPLGTAVQIAVAFGLGMLLGGVYFASESVVPCITAHLALNGTAWFFSAFSSARFLKSDVIVISLYGLLLIVGSILGIAMATGVTAEEETNHG